MKEKSLSVVLIGLFLPSWLHATTGFSLLIPILFVGIFFGFVVAFYKVFMFFWDAFFGAIGFFRFFGASRKTSFLLIVLLSVFIYYVYGERIGDFVNLYIKLIVIQYLPDI